MILSSINRLNNNNDKIAEINNNYCLNFPWYDSRIQMQDHDDITLTDPDEFFRFVETKV